MAPFGVLIAPAYKALSSLQLASTEEYIDGKFTGNLGEVLIRQAACHSQRNRPNLRGALHHDKNSGVSNILGTDSLCTIAHVLACSPQSALHVQVQQCPLHERCARGR